MTVHPVDSQISGCCFKCQELAGVRKFSPQLKSREGGKRFIYLGPNFLKSPIRQASLCSICFNFEETQLPEFVGQFVSEIGHGAAVTRRRCFLDLFSSAKNPNPFYNS